jgi:hypothetical protein
MTHLATTGTARAAGIPRNPKRRTTPQRLAMVPQVAAAGARTCLDRFFERLHQSRRRHAAVVLARYRHLTHDPKTGEPRAGLSFGMNATTPKAAPAA